MVEFMDMLVQKRRFFFAGLFVFIDLLLASFLVSAAQNHHANAAPQTHDASASTAPANIYDSPNVVTNALSMVVDNFTQAADTTNQKISSTAEATAMGVAQSGKAVKHGVIASISFAGRAISTTGSYTEHFILGSWIFTGRLVFGSIMFTVHIIGGGSSSIGHAVGSGAASIGHAVDNIPQYASDITDVSAVIRPPDHTHPPVITQLQAQQVALIESGTKDVVVAAASKGTGGACDSGNGNGGYPLAWCNAPMDSVSTIPYNGDPINRECTSYAYWYFTSIEGHTSFRARGDAKYWAATSNYPTHTVPAVGAIAVEVAGAYGHVAIVQALPGQKYAGHVVPAGYVLVSEMNYDWYGHFRYSYSPLSKFSAYIYR